MYGFSPGSRSKGAERLGHDRLDLRRSSTFGRSLGVSALGVSAAPPPARRPKTSRSESELPPSRFEPCMPGGALAGGEEPRHRRRGGVGIDPDAAHRSSGRSARPPSAPRDVDVSQLLELVVHRGQPPLDVLGGPARGDVEEDAAVRGAAAGLDLGVDGARDLVAREQLGRAPRRLLVLVPAVGLLLGVGRLGREHARGCSRT